MEIFAYLRRFPYMIYPQEWQVFDEKLKHIFRLNVHVECTPEFLYASQGLAATPFLPLPRARRNLRN